jgi:hypothetical protein
MKLLKSAFAFHFLTVVIFAIIYYSISSEHFVSISGSKTPLTFIDYFNLSITIQASVGLSSILPSTNLAKTLTIIQQCTLLLGNVSILYLFSQI